MNNKFLNSKFSKREKRIRKTYEIDIAVSNVKGLAKLSETTPFTIKSLVNMSIKNII